MMYTMRSESYRRRIGFLFKRSFERIQRMMRMNRTGQAQVNAGKEGMIRGSKVVGFGLAVLCVLLLSCGDVPVLQEEIFYPQIDQPSVTVKLLESKSRLVLGSNGPFVIRCFSSRGQRSVYYASAEMTVELSHGKMILGEKNQGELESDLRKVSFVPKQGAFWIYLNGLPYRGVLEVVRDQNEKSIRVFNLVYVEDYLKGVVPAEMGKLTGREIEALKAQAVAARTYSLSRRGQYGDGRYDLEATVADQVYRGVRGEDPLGNRAVEETRKEILIHRGKVVQAYYHANSGGRTEDVNRVWGKPRETYLTSVEDSDFCSWSESYNWEESWTGEDLKRNIQKFLLSTNLLSAGQMGELLDLRVIQRAPSGRVEVLEVLTHKGNYQIVGDRIRWALRRGSNPNLILPSTRFTLQIQRDESGSIQLVSASGRGNGHGVGMCQTGAIGMARNGYSYKDILTFYYPGAHIAQWN